jgi:hypothetical protein
LAYVARYDWDVVVDRYRDEYRQAFAHAAREAR